MLLLPLAYYRATGNDREDYQSIPSTMNAPYSEDALKNDTLEKYRYYWYEMGQRNLHYDPINRQSLLAFFGERGRLSGHFSFRKSEDGRVHSRKSLYF